MAQAAPGKPKPAFFLAVLAVVAGLVGMAFWRCNAKKESAGADNGSAIDLSNIKKQSGANGSGTQAENPDPNSTATTVKEYTYEAATRLPQVPGTADYKKLGTPRIVHFAVNTWAGWAPIIWANQGHKAGKIWKDAKGGDFQVELQLSDNPVAMRDAFAHGDTQIGWATVDMLPLLIQSGLNKDPRTMPRVFQQIDWSNGGDGIVVREGIKTVTDLKGKTIALAQNSPSHFFLLNMLLNGGVQPKDVKMQFTADAFQAAAAFNQDKKGVAAAVSWSPDIYNLTKPGSGNKLLISTTTANKLIADVWYARADFARDNPEIIEGIVRGILDSVEDLKTEANKPKVGELMDEFYGLPKGSGKDMLGDAHWANYAENKDFFLNQNNPTNFERTYTTAYLLYRAIGSVDDKVPFDQIMDFSVIKKLGADPKYSAQTNDYEFKFTPVSSVDVNVEDKAVLTKTVTIQFFPNSNELFKKVPSKTGGPDTFYDPNVQNTIEDIAKLAGQFGAARIQISGHTDASMRGQADEGLVKELSLRRANAVKEALVNKPYSMKPDQFITAGFGWDKPADPKDPDNHAKNRRVEVKVIPAEAQ